MFENPAAPEPAIAGNAPDHITVSAVCFSYRSIAAAGTSTARDLTLGVRKRGTSRFMQPGGKPEIGETALQCAVREVEEELGIVLDPTTLTLLGEFTTQAANEKNTLLHSTVFVAPEVLDPAEFAPRAEIEEVRWFDIDAAPEPGLLAPLFELEVLPRLRALRDTRG